MTPANPTDETLPEADARGAKVDDVTELERDAAAAGAATRPSKWAIHRHLYDWVIGFAHKRHSTWALAGLSFAESSFFPIPPDVLLLPMCLGKRSKAWWFATVCTLASVLGGVAGYFIGYAAWEAVDQYVFKYVPGFKPETFERVAKLYQEYDFWIVFAAALTPIPYKVFTIAGGVFHVALVPFILASIVGRGVRFFAEAALMYAFGPTILPFVDRYFNLLSILFTLLLIGGFVLVKYV
jgi:membrane protein YqaA with SNARE-associated domain